MKLLAGVLVLLQFAAGSAAWGDDVFVIAKPRFSARVLNDGNYSVIGPALNGQISRRTLDQGALYFSMTILGRDKAMQYLHDKDQLDADAVIFCGGIRSDTVSIGITQQKWSDVSRLLSDQFESDGFFSFRTFMKTRQTQCGSIEIMIRDGAGNTVGRESVRIVP